MHLRIHQIPKVFGTEDLKECHVPVGLLETMILSFMRLWSDRDRNYNPSLQKDPLVLLGGTHRDRKVVLALQDT